MDKYKNEEWVPGWDIENIEDFKLFKKIMLKLLKGYPKRFYQKIFEYYEEKYGKDIVQTLKDHGILDVFEIKGNNVYRLSAKGVDLAISMINLDYSEKIEKYAKETNIFTKLIGSLTGVIILLNFIQIVPALTLTFSLIIILLVLITFKELNARN